MRWTQMNKKMNPIRRDPSNRQSMRLRNGVLFAGLAVLIALMPACSVFQKNTPQKQVVKETSKSQKEQITVIPQSDSSTKEYQTIRPKSPSDTRGYIQYGVGNRVDIDEIETKLQDLSKGPFDPSHYYFQEGQFLSTSFIDSLLSRQDKTHPDGLNPPLGKGKDLGVQATNSPKYLSYILEQDYLNKSDKKLGGISLAISVNSVYSDNLYNKKNGMTYPVDVTLDPKKSMAEAKKDAVKIVQKVRSTKGLESIPIMVGLYIESQPGSFVPGHYFAKTTVAGKSASIGKWTKVDQEVQLFPSAAAQSKYKSDSDKFSKFSSDVQSYFSNSIGVIGKGFYKNGNLSELTVVINERFYDKTETVSFANYVDMLIKNKFPFSSDIPVQVYINSINQPEAIIVNRPNMDQPFVHIYTLYK